MLGTFRPIGVSLPFPKIESMSDDEVELSSSRISDTTPSTATMITDTTPSTATTITDTTPSTATTITDTTPSTATTITDKDNGIEHETNTETTRIKVEELSEDSLEKTLEIDCKSVAIGLEEKEVASQEVTKSNYFPSSLLQRLERTLDQVLETKTKQKTEVQLTTDFIPEEEKTENCLVHLDQGLEGNVLESKTEDQVDDLKSENLEQTADLSLEGNQEETKNDPVNLKQKSDRISENVSKLNKKHQVDGSKSEVHIKTENNSEDEKDLLNFKKRLEQISGGLKSETRHLMNGLKSKNVQLAVDLYPAIMEIKNDLVELRLRLEQTFDKVRELKKKYKENTDETEEVWYEAVEDLNENEKFESIKNNISNLKDKLQLSSRKDMGLVSEHSTEKVDANLEMLKSNTVPELFKEEKKFNEELITEMEVCIEELDKENTISITQSENRSSTDSRQEETHLNTHEETQLDTEMNLKETDAKTVSCHDVEQNNKDAEETPGITQASALDKTVEEEQEGVSTDNVGQFQRPLFCLRLTFIKATLKQPIIKATYHSLHIKSACYPTRPKICRSQN